ncbi:MAG TPA: ElyC/SanA/YdcF family protein [Dehalococcoidia bacterium]
MARARAGTRPRRAGASRRLITLSRLLALGGLAGVVALLLLFGPALWVIWRSNDLRYDDPANVPRQQTAIVFGAGLKLDGTPSALLSDRIHAAALLYFDGRVRQLLMSGDGGAPGHDEPAAMAKQAEAEGVPATAILQDPGGVHTYASCQRAHDLFGVTNAVAVSQSYHLPRAIFTCSRLGIHTVGFSLARTPYSGDLGLRVRELISLDAAWWELLAKRGPGWP